MKLLAKPKNICLAIAVALVALVDRSESRLTSEVPQAASDGFWAIAGNLKDRALHGSGSSKGHGDDDEATFEGCFVDSAGIFSQAHSNCCTKLCGTTCRSQSTCMISPTHCMCKSSHSDMLNNAATIWVAGVAFGLFLTPFAVSSFASREKQVDVISRWFTAPIVVLWYCMSALFGIVGFMLMLVLAQLNHAKDDPNAATISPDHPPTKVKRRLSLKQDSFRMEECPQDSPKNGKNQAGTERVYLNPL